MNEKTITVALPAGLHEFDKRSGAVRCDDCGRWADAGDKIRHGKQCDTPELQAVAITNASLPRLSWATTQGGQRVVVGPVSMVVVGATLEVDGKTASIASVGKTFERNGVACRYGYTSSRATRARGCNECGRAFGHRMDCALL